MNLYVNVLALSRQCDTSAVPYLFIPFWALTACQSMIMWCRSLWRFRAKDLGETFGLSRRKWTRSCQTDIFTSVGLNVISLAPSSGRGEARDDCHDFTLCHVYKRLLSHACHIFHRSSYPNLLLRNVFDLLIPFVPWKKTHFTSDTQHCGSILIDRVTHNNCWPWGLCVWSRGVCHQVKLTTCVNCSGVILYMKYMLYNK